MREGCVEDSDMVVVVVAVLIEISVGLRVNPPLAAQQDVLFPPQQ